MAVPEIVEQRATGNRFVIAEATASNVDDIYDSLERIYQGDNRVTCPQPSTHLIPTRQDAKFHLQRGNRLVCAWYGDELTHVLLVDGGRIRTCWGKLDKALMGEVQWHFAEYFESVGEDWLLDTGTPGWVTAEFFGRYAPGGGPFDVSTWHPGLPEGAVYGDFSDGEWTLRIWRMTPDHAWQWEVTLL